MARRPKIKAPSTKATDAALRAQTRAFEKQVATDLKEIRHNFALLKRKGVIRKSTNVRTLKATKYRKRQLKDLQGILTGDLAAVKANRKIRNEFKEQGARIVNGRILVSKHPEEIARVKKGEFTEGVVTLRRPLSNGYASERIVLPVRFAQLKPFIDGIMDNPKQFDKLKNAADNFAFQVGGNNTTAQTAFTGMAELAEYLLRYDDILSWAEENPELDAADFLSLHRIMPGYRLDEGDTGESAKRMGRVSRAARASQGERRERQLQLKRELAQNRTPRPLKPRHVRDQNYRNNVKANRPERAEEIKNAARTRKARNQPPKNPFRGNPQ